ncbi:MAG TPA: hypothetical protein VNJ01_09915 [Bacteriovoracaceae bacterium]|nr:hypothetical protein [Bacteriovoracaceae bacterium]
MRIIFFVIILTSVSVHASIVGITTHPLKNNAKLLSAEMTGYMGQRLGMGAGVRYTQEMTSHNYLDLSVASTQDAKAMYMGAAMDLEVISEDMRRPRVSVKPFLQIQRYDDVKASVVGAAPSLRKGFSLRGVEFFPFLAVPAGIKLDSPTDEFEYYASLTMGASMPFPGTNTDKLLLSIEGNKDLGAASDYLGCLVSWIWN